ncbi:MAG: aminotransferase class I/II-fold pyridoxal phosphate-dependent enzyme [Erysipelotrichaceae bacterium]
MNKKYSQSDAPIEQALLAYKAKRTVSFDVPGHKQGKGNKRLTQFLGEDTMQVDVNSMKPLDNLCHPVGVIKDAQELAAQAFHAAAAFFMLNGTSSGVQAMIMSALKENEEIILPRNVHRSAINALILCGAKPIYVNPSVNTHLGIPLGMKIEDIKAAIKQHPNAKAILVNNPTYYGICSNLKEIVKIAHEANMLVLVDEAHGTHFYFQENSPISGMDAGADMAAVSIHKTGGSLTQSSLLLLGKNVNEDYVRQIINLTQTTSGSYLLMASLDISRSNLAVNGKNIFNSVMNFANYARDEVNSIKGYYAYGKELINGDDIYDFDATKLSIHTRDIGLAGIEVYNILRDEYNIQIEFGDIGNILAIISVGDRDLEIERLLSALDQIKRDYQKDPQDLFDHEYVDPIVEMTPKKAFYAKQKHIKLEESINKISGEFVMCYPPGIPILAPGELITKDIIDYISYAKEKGCQLTGTQDMDINTIQVVMEEN